MHKIDYIKYVFSAKRMLQQSQRPISKHSIRVLDAPDLRNDFYLSLLSWDVHNILAVALGIK